MGIKTNAIIQEKETQKSLSRIVNFKNKQARNFSWDSLTQNWQTMDENKVGEQQKIIRKNTVLFFGRIYTHMLCYVHTYVHITHISIIFTCQIPCCSGEYR